jgi:Zn-dependent M28 family amino/carboxypeptidase
MKVINTALTLALALATCHLGAANAAPVDPAASLPQLRDHAMTSDYAWQRLADMTDLIGPRLTGSAGAAAAVQQVASAMRALGAKVTLQPVTVPHWVRGEETAQLVDYAGRPQGITQRIVLTALGGSGATPAVGLTAPVVVVHSFEELRARAAEVKGCIVLIDTAFDQGMADAGLPSPAYGAGSAFRTRGPQLAASLGAAAALVRSVGGANYRLPHAGATSLDPINPIPAAAVTVEDALLINRLAARGAVTMHLTLTPQRLPDVQSHNVIADWPGTDLADEVVIVSGHLDSWDLGTGAEDDGSAITAAMGVIEAMQKLGLKPRRTIRMVAWMNEEGAGGAASAGVGGSTYFTANRAQVARHFAAIESDSGTGRPFGMVGSVGLQAEPLFAPLRAALQPIGAGLFQRRDALRTGDLHALETAGVPSFMPLLDARKYFDYHHTAADTLDKVDPENLRRHVAVMASTAWFLANIDTPIGRAPAQLP